MATLDALINKFQTAASGLRSHVETNVVLTANDMIGTIAGRLTETGKDDKGLPFKDYTERYKLFKAGLTKKKIARATKKLDKTLNAGKTPTPKLLDRSIGIAGRYKGYVDFQLTGRMLANVKIIAKNTTSGNVKISIGNTGKDNIEKMEDNIKERGQFFTPSKKEFSQSQKQFNERSSNYFERIFKT